MVIGCSLKFAVACCKPISSATISNDSIKTPIPQCTTFGIKSVQDIYPRKMNCCNKKQFYTHTPSTWVESTEHDLRCVPYRVITQGLSRSRNN